MARVDPTFRIVPCRALRCGRADLIPSQAPFRLVSSTWSQRDSEVDSAVPLGLMPALLTSTSSPPSRADDLVHDAGPVVGPGHVERQAHGLVTGSDQPVGRAGGRRSVDIRQGHLQPGRRECLRDPQAHTLSRAGDEGRGSRNDAARRRVPFLEPGCFQPGRNMIQSGAS